MKRARGFSLIGVLVSLLVLTLGVFALVRVQHTLMLDTQNAGDYAGATNLAQSALEQRKACAPSLCASSDFTPQPSGSSVAPAAYLCRVTTDADMATIAVRWLDAQGTERTLEVTSPRTDCATPPP
ncbi:hypothetical protein [Craterilacuibacter sp.]|uniref:hypothetical protein n=1 Tax=Craterilacuibacter sp. TaxID=2870909 RepID=UPI003F2B7824